MWTDNETKIDLIGFKVHADLIQNVVTDEKVLPTVLGVFGDWGGGKSSIMQMLKHELETDVRYKDDVICLYFNGWMFEGYEDAKTALLSSILKELKDNQRIGEKAKEQINNLLQRVDYMEVLKTGAKAVWKYVIPILVTVWSGGSIPAIIPALLGSLINEKASGEDKESEKPGKEKDASDFSKLLKDSAKKSDFLEIRKFREDFGKMLAETNIQSLVILIDDLDRCLPERIIETLEAIKLFVLVPKTAFVIGADRRIVEHAISTRYVSKQFEDLNKSKSESDKSKTEAITLITDYLEKLIQIPYQLPRLSPSEIETYINLLACQKYLTCDEDKNLVLEDWKSKRSKNFYFAYQYDSIKAVLGVGKITPELEKQLTWSSSIAHVITEGLKGNPRQVKRMLNMLLLRKKLAEVGKIEIKDEILAKIMVLEYSHLQRFYELNEWQVAEDGHPAKLKKLEKIAREEDDAEPIKPEDKLEDWQTPSVQKWLQMEPALKEVDLRDYFWLMRDRTSSTLAGVNMVSPLVRKIYTGLLDGNDGEKEVEAKHAAELENPDREALLGLLQQQITSYPKQRKGYEALLNLATKNVDGAGYTFTKLVGEISPEFLPTQIAPDLSRLGGVDAQFQPYTERLLKLFADKHSKTQLGKAASKELEKIKR